MSHAQESMNQTTQLHPTMKIDLYNEALTEIIGSVEGVRNEPPTVDNYDGVYDLNGAEIEGPFSLETFEAADGSEAFTISW